VQQCVEGLHDVRRLQGLMGGSDQDEFMTVPT
jgi:hypothetical protein